VGLGERRSPDARRTPASEKSLGVVLAILSGVAMAAQGRINGQLGAELHDSMLAAVISFGGGLVLLILALPFFTKMRAGIRKVRRAVADRTLKPWHLLGGIGGAVFVAGQSVTVALIGVAMFTVGVVAGQTVSGLFVDKAGLGPAGPQPLTWTRVLGAMLTLAAVLGALSGGVSGGASLWLLVLPVVAGACMAVQQAVNGRVGAAASNALTAAFVNFVTGTSALLLAWLVSLLLRGGPTAFPHNPLLYLGGLVGIVFISLASFVVQWTGVLLLGLSAIAGQLVGSVLLDVLVPAKGEHLSTPTLVGTGVALVAIVIAAAPVRRR
jgi:transporter family-2 protein